VRENLEKAHCYLNEVGVIFSEPFEIKKGFLKPDWQELLFDF